jgi:GC-rich sequence DNA-binding factor
MDIDEYPLGPDGDLVIEMTQKAVLPFLTKSLEAQAYDPYSLPQTRKAIDLAEVIHSLCGQSSKKYADLLRAIMAVFAEEVTRQTGQIADCLATGAIPPPSFDPASREALGRFVRRRLKLIRNLLMWKREAAREVGEITSRIVGEVLRPVLERQWGGGGRELAQTVSHLDR